MAAKAITSIPSFYLMAIDWKAANPLNRGYKCPL